MQGAAKKLVNSTQCKLFSFEMKYCTWFEKMFKFISCEYINIVKENSLPFAKTL